MGAREQILCNAVEATKEADIMQDNDVVTAKVRTNGHDLSMYNGLRVVPIDVNQSAAGERRHQLGRQGREGAMVPNDHGAKVGRFINPRAVTNIDRMNVTLLSRMFQAQRPHHG